MPSIEPLAFRRAATFGLGGEIAITFTKPVAASTAIVSSHYILEPNGTTTSTRIDPNDSSVVLLQTTGSPQRIRVTGVEDLLGDALPPNSVVDIEPQTGTGDDGPILSLPSINGSDVQIEFLSSPGVTYRVEQSQDLIHWTPIGEVSANSDRTRGTIPLPSDAGRQFVRVLRY